MVTSVGSCAAWRPVLDQHLRRVRQLRSFRLTTAHALRAQFGSAVLGLNPAERPGERVEWPRHLALARTGARAFCGLSADHPQTNKHADRQLCAVERARSHVRAAATLSCQWRLSGPPESRPSRTRWESTVIDAIES